MYIGLMDTNQEAQTYLANMSKKTKPLATEIHTFLISLGCVSYVKTIYIGYSINEEMVAAMYGHVDHLEIAIALPENTESAILVDASHLTWRTLPVAAIVKQRIDMTEFREMAKIAVTNVNTKSHYVNRDNDFFTMARRKRSGL
jgi:hypothetical protein